MIWAGLIRRAAHEFAVPPADFWRLSLREWRALTETPHTQPLSRADFDALVADHPDTGKTYHER